MPSVRRSTPSWRTTRGRDLLLPALHAVQARAGWISQRRPQLHQPAPDGSARGALGSRHLLPSAVDETRARRLSRTCATTSRAGCEAARALCESLEQVLGPPGASGESGGATAWMRSPCLGQCERAPAVLLTVAGETPRTITLAPVEDGVASVLDALRDPPPHERYPPRRGQPGRAPAPRLALGAPGRAIRVAAPRPDRACRSDESRRLPRERRLRALGARHRARARPPSSPRSSPRSSSAAAAPRFRPDASGTRWRRREARPHYLVCNADESEPGTFKDRLLMEEDPFALVEGMTLAGFATGCERGYLYLRGEYPLAAERMAGAIARGARGRPAGRRRDGRRVRLRHRDSPGRRRVHLRRGDRAVQLDRGQARRAAEQAAVPGPGRALRQADRREQRGDARERARAPARGRRRVRRDRHGRLDRPEALLRLRRGRAPRTLRGAIRDHLAAASPSGRGRGPSARCCSAAPPACSSARPTSTWR